MPKIDSIEDLIDCNIDDFILEGCDPHPPIRAEMLFKRVCYPWF